MMYFVVSLVFTMCLNACSFGRGLALGIALTVYGREEEADALIDQLTIDQDPILRYGGMYALALAYRGTANNKAIHKLLHFAVSDVSDDVRRTAVLALGFVLYSEPEQVSSLLIDTVRFNPFRNMTSLELSYIILYGYMLHAEGYETIFQLMIQPFLKYDKLKTRLQLRFNLYEIW